MGQDLSHQKSITVTSDASGDGEGTMKIRGYLDALKIEYGGTPDAGTDVVITIDPNGWNEAVLTLTNNNTDGFYRVRRPSHTNVGAELGAENRPFVDAELHTLLDEAVVSTADAVKVTARVFS